MISDEKITLRMVRNIDVPKIFQWENDKDNWLVSETKISYTFEEINLLIESAEDIFETGQLRLIIHDNKSKETIGTLDLFQTDFEKKSTNVGILIADNKNRRKGYAEAAVILISKYCLESFNFEQLQCSIQSFNKASLELFKKCGFQKLEVEKENPIFDLKTDEIVKMILWLKR